MPTTAGASTSCATHGSGGSTDIGTGYGGAAGWANAHRNQLRTDGTPPVRGDGLVVGVGMSGALVTIVR